MTSGIIQLHPTGDEPNVIWEPYPGSQSRFLTCPFREVLYEGTRGPGKTDALLMSFAQWCGVGFGAAWRGIIFRETFPQLKDVVAKSRRWFSQIFPAARFNESDHCWSACISVTLARLMTIGTTMVMSIPSSVGRSLLTGLTSAFILQCFPAIDHPTAIAVCLAWCVLLLTPGE